MSKCRIEEIRKLRLQEEMDYLGLYKDFEAKIEQELVALDCREPHRIECCAYNTGKCRRFPMLSRLKLLWDTANGKEIAREAVFDLMKSFETGYYQKGIVTDLIRIIEASDDADTKPNGLKIRPFFFWDFGKSILYLLYNMQPTVQVSNKKSTLASKMFSNANHGYLRNSKRYKTSEAAATIIREYESEVSMNRVIPLSQIEFLIQKVEQQKRALTHKIVMVIEQLVDLGYDDESIAHVIEGEIERETSVDGLNPDLWIAQSIWQEGMIFQLELEQDKKAAD
jgi:hypothetical protein